MSDKSVYEKMAEFTRAEKLYRAWFGRHPYDSFPPAESWADFKKMYEAAARQTGDDFSLPNEPPSYIGGSLTEKDWFAAEASVSVFRHCRYTPAFLHKLEFIKIIYVMSGSCRLFNRQGEIAGMSAGNICIVQPETEHAVFGVGDDCLIVNILMRRSTFEAAFFSLLTEQGTVSAFFWEMLYKADGSRMLLIKGEPNERVKNPVLELYAEANFQEHRSRLILNSWLCLLIGQIQRIYAEDIVQLGERRAQSSGMLELLKYMTENIREITLVSAARRFGMSEGYMSRRIAGEFGLTFKQLLRRLRLERAAELLASSDYSAEAAAEAVGYTNQSRFYRNFKEFFGCTPGEYKKGHKKQ